MSTFIWPFRTKVGGNISSPNDPTTQGRRIDQGWDIQGVTSSEEDCLAIASGTVTYAHDPGSNGAHFGDPYPVLHLAVPVDGISSIYYGHTHPLVPERVYVRQGDAIARTSTPGGGGVVYPHWLEIGPWINGPTGNGQWMHDHLVNAPVYNPLPTPSPTPTEDTMVIISTDGQPAQYALAGGVVALIPDIPSLQAWEAAGAIHVKVTKAAFDRYAAAAV